MDIPRRDPVSTPWYYGEGAHFLPKTEVLNHPYPELFTVGGTIPSSGGIPRINPRSVAARVAR